ncbi:MAG: hypothetical protein RIB93_01160 [Coleofasciculus sp. D1-CHI-01]|uniref:hypothetical protein n=1 Tax=Coleofasciculus sp. D1-CHI-01 TaxID=3068482 RepID=UPI0032F11CBF
MALAGNQAAIARSAEGRQSHHGIDRKGKGDRTVCRPGVGAIDVRPIKLMGIGNRSDRTIELTGTEQAIARLN